MKIALLSDIHANLPALKAVLADIRREKADEIWNLGDLVGYGPFPNEVVDLAQSEMAESIIGNYDAKVLAFEAKKRQWKKSKDPVKYFSFQWNADHLSAPSREFLKSLSSQATLSKDGVTFLLVHGSPQAEDEGLTAQTSAGRLQTLTRMVKADVVACGHSHLAFDRKAGGVLFVNPGSVGRPFDADPRSSYSLLKITGRRVEVLNRRIDYDLSILQNKMKDEGFPPELFRSISSGQSLDTLQSQSITS